MIPLPTRHLHVSGVLHERELPTEKSQPIRRDAAATMPPEPHVRQAANVRHEERA